MGLTIRHFESAPCTRCGGSGTYSWTSRWGSTCFKCGTKAYTPGSGWALTKAGAAAREAWIAANREEVPASAVKVGDVLSFGADEKWRVDEIESCAGTEAENFGASKSGDNPWTYWGLRFTRVHNRTGERMGRPMSADTMVLRLTPGRLALPPEMEPGTPRRAEMKAYVAAAEALAKDAQPGWRRAESAAFAHSRTARREANR